MTQAIDKMDGAKLDRFKVQLSVKYAQKRTKNIEDNKKNKNNIYLRCLPHGLTKAQLIGLCKEFGEVTCTRLMVDVGIAFVRYRIVHSGFVQKQAFSELSSPEKRAGDFLAL